MQKKNNKQNSDFSNWAIAWWFAGANTLYVIWKAILGELTWDGFFGYGLFYSAMSVFAAFIPIVLVFALINWAVGRINTWMNSHFEVKKPLQGPDFVVVLPLITLVVASGVYAFLCLPEETVFGWLGIR